MAKKQAIDFKIIALKPLGKNNGDINRILRPGVIYNFFNDYTVHEDDSIKHEKTYPSNLYDLRGTKINISAIAGKNGTGKSTIVDLLMMAINNIACHFDMNPNLVAVSELKMDLYIKLKQYHKISIRGTEISVFNYDASGKLIENNVIGSEFVANDLFYTITMNYSHYAHNIFDYKKGVDEDWLSGLFHKNDSYQTPLVINPWRDNGNIDINRENGLVTARLIANLVRPSMSSTYDFRNITENFRALALKISPKPNKVYSKEFYRKEDASSKKRTWISVTLSYLFERGKINKDLILEQINNAYDFGYEKYKETASEVDVICMDYLIGKLITISLKYDEYNGNYIIEDDDFDYKKLSSYIKKIARDRSHIGFKFRQTLNYLRHKHIDYLKDDLPLDGLSNKIIDVIGMKSSYKDKIIELIPPPIFSVDIVLGNYKGEISDATFKSLSSGEKQMVYSTSSILYHLANLDSVAQSTPKKVKYRVVQIFLEEIELYFHPEMQRNYINYLRSSIQNLELSSIKNISICLITHSPFILSDIPTANVMSLSIENGKAIQLRLKRKTFAANIHSLLADSFFMQDGLCGAYAIGCVNCTINFLNTSNELRLTNLKLQKDENNQELLDYREQLTNEVSGIDKNDHKLLINNIAEPILAIKLHEMYDEAFPEILQKEQIKFEITRLQQLLDKS